LRFSATLQSPPHHLPIHGRPTDFVTSSDMVCAPSNKKSHSDQRASRTNCD
jgi:hypothetical protein